MNRMLSLVLLWSWGLAGHAANLYKKEWDLSPAALEQSLSPGSSTQATVRQLMGPPDGDNAAIRLVWAQQRIVGKYMEECSEASPDEADLRHAEHYGGAVEVWLYRYRDTYQNQQCGFMGCSGTYGRSTLWFMFDRDGILIRYGKKLEGSDMKRDVLPQDYCPAIVSMVCANPAAPPVGKRLQARCAAPKGFCCH